jgi:uncharacterized protein DUF5132
MALVEDLFKGNIVTGLAVGIGAVVLGPIVAPAITAVLRPAAKAVIKTGIYAYDWGCTALSQVNEMTGDIVAEARSEVGHHRGRAKPAGGS